MAKTTRQTAIFGVEDWRKIFQTYREADFQSYDFETLRKSFVDYLRVHYPETFNDYVESSEFIALLDVMAFMGQSLAFRSDLNARENFIETAERRDNVVKLAELVSYSPKRNIAASGFLKITSITTTENLIDYNGNNLAGAVVNWNDVTNPDWHEQFITIINAALVDSQRVGKSGHSQDILGVKTDEYSINVVPGFLPVLGFNATVNNSLLAFEAVNATSKNSLSVYEPAPRPSSKFNILYRNDRLGFASPNSGFFFYFKQGKLKSQDFTLSDRIANRTVSINIDGVNNTDVWLFKLGQAGGIDTEWAKTEGIFGELLKQSRSERREFYEIVSSTNDSINLVFGDGVFAEIPTGSFRAYARQSVGLEYVINPSEIQAIPFSMSYVSRRGRIETISFTASLTVPVTNAKSRESLDEIRQRAPSRFYTQNRMVNGEDYTLMPYATFGSVVKSKAVNRSSVGVSRFLDSLDPTGKYSSTNNFGSDGVLFSDPAVDSFSFSWTDRIDIVSLIETRVKPLLFSRETIHFYYNSKNFPRITAPGVFWNQASSTVNETTGYFRAGNNTVLPIGQFASDNKKYLRRGALLKFIAPPGYQYDEANRLVISNGAAGNTKQYIWATVKQITGNGTNSGLGVDSRGQGAVSINEFVPSGSILSEIVPEFKTSLPIELVDNIIDEILLNRNFGISYDYLNRIWKLIPGENLFIDGDFQLGNNELDSSWLIQFTTDGNIYTVKSRRQRYSFASISENRFYYDGSGFSIFDPKLGRVVNDYVKVLKSNLDNNRRARLPDDVTLDIIGQTVESDGFVDNFKVNVSYSDNDLDGIADDPDFFDKLVSPDSQVFFQRILDSDNLTRLLPLEAGEVNTIYSTKSELEKVKFRYNIGQVFYAYGEDKYYSIAPDPIRTIVLKERYDFELKTGRSGLLYQYKHYSPSSKRIDPGTSNIIDIFVVTKGYYTAFKNYITDSTNTVSEPAKPTIEQLSAEYAQINEFRMMSDSVVLNSVKFKPLFGDKASPGLQALFKITRFANVAVSDSDIKSRVISAINEYFSIDNWDFGDTFYFSELAAFLHSAVGDVISSVTIVPKDASKTFGDLHEIRAEPSEIFVNAATVNNIEIIDAITPAAIRSTRAMD